MKKLFGRFLPVLFACMLACMPVFAEETGSISINITAYAGEETVNGGSLSLYQIADADDCNFVYLEEFKDLDSSLLTQDGLEQSDTAETFETYIKEKNIHPIQTQTVNSEGKADFSNLPEGLYLIAQEISFEDYTDINAFLVTVPYTENGVTTYDVNASPKVAPVEKIKEPEPEPEPTPTPESEPAEESEPEPDVSGEGPKTGDASHIWIFVLMLAVAGIGGGCIYKHYYDEKREAEVK